MIERPTTGYCQQLLLDDSECGVEFEVKPTGNIAKYCLEHRDQEVRRKLNLQRKRQAEALAKGEPLVDPGEGAVPPTPQARVCRAPYCQIPLADEWPNDFCVNDWRRISLETRGLLVNGGAETYEKGVFHALRELKPR